MKNVICSSNITIIIFLMLSYVVFYDIINDHCKLRHQNTRVEIGNPLNIFSRKRVWNTRNGTYVCTTVRYTTWVGRYDAHDHMSANRCSPIFNTILVCGLYAQVLMTVCFAQVCVCVNGFVFVCEYVCVRVCVSLSSCLCVCVYVSAFVNVCCVRVHNLIGWLKSSRQEMSEKNAIACMQANLWIFTFIWYVNRYH